jgi:hypothetical protein
MSTLALWEVLREKLAASAARKRGVVLQHLGLSDDEVQALRPLLDKLGERLALRLELHSHAGDIVLLDGDFAARVSPQLLQAFNEDRPVVLIASPQGDDGRLLPAAEAFERRQQDLLRQLREIAVVRRRSAHWGPSGWAPAALGADEGGARPSGSATSGFDSDFDSNFDADQLAAERLDDARRALLQAVLRGALDASAPRLSASYGPAANLLFDFGLGVVTIDALARRQLRVHRELPLAAPGARPQADATVHEIDEVLWDLGLASGRFALLDEPADWWHAALQSPPSAHIARYTRMPRHLEMARRLQAAPVTASDLRRDVLVGVAELRSFVQACLFLRLAQWLPPVP